MSFLCYSVALIKYFCYLEAGDLNRIAKKGGGGGDERSGPRKDFAA